MLIFFSAGSMFEEIAHYATTLDAIGLHLLIMHIYTLSAK
jgi:hypothetical protein